MSGTLGCGAYRVEVRSRGGGSPIEDLRFDSLSYGRRVDDVSAASVTVGTEGLSNEACCAVLSTLRSWQHELAIWRDTTLVWAGPVLEPRFSDDKVVIGARDLFQWFERRTLPTDRIFTGIDLGVIFAQLVTDALSGDTSPNITCVPTNTGVPGTRIYQAAAHTRAADALRELSRSGVDWSAIARTIVIGGEEVPAANIGVLTSDHLLKPQLDQRGLDAASRVTVLGAAGISATAGGVDATMGLVEQTVNEATIADPVSALAAAASRVAMLSPAPEYLSGRLSDTAPFDFSQLIPGARVDIRTQIGCRLVLATMRMTAVDVQVQASDAGVDEAVGVTFIPIGTTSGP